MTITSPACIVLDLIALFAATSPSKTRAGPVNSKPSLPVILATDPSVARLP